MDSYDVIANQPIVIDNVSVTGLCRLIFFSRSSALLVYQTIQTTFFYAYTLLHYSQSLLTHRMICMCVNYSLKSAEVHITIPSRLTITRTVVNDMLLHPAKYHAGSSSFTS